MRTRAATRQGLPCLTVWVEAALVIAAAALLFHLIGEIRALGASPLAQSARKNTLVTGLIGQHQSIRGLDAFGHLVTKHIPTGTNHAVVFVVRRDNYQRDISYWEEVAALVANKSHVWLLGFCNGLACNAETHSAGTPSFALVAYGEVEGLETAHRADNSGDLIIADQRGAITSLYPWRARTPTATADYLGQLK